MKTPRVPLMKPLKRAFLKTRLLRKRLWPWARLRRKRCRRTAYQQALAEGVDPREAVYRAENAVRDDLIGMIKLPFSDCYKYNVFRDIRSYILRCLPRGRIKQQISGPDVSRRDVDVVEQAAYLALDNAYQSDDPKGLSFLFSASNINQTAGVEHLIKPFFLVVL